MHKFLLILALFVGINCFVPAVFAQEQKQITIVNPIRGQDFWEYPYGILDTPKKQLEVINKNNLEATWLVRYDALKNPEVVSFLKTLNSKQETGIFLEVTPSLTKDAGVTYNQSSNWHFAKSVLVTGYSPADRIKLIDTVMGRYKEVFGNNPKSVGAWWIDANSLQYLHDKYQVEVNMDVSDQFSTDGYQVWGQYWSSPFYPSKRNALMPASSEGEKIGITTIQWAGRDPFNGYGNSVFESTYSVQSNDYLLHDLGIDYFKKLILPYPQVVVGLENDFDWNKFGAEYSKQVEHVANLQTQNVRVVTMQHFAQAYKLANPKLSPKVLISSDDPLGSDGKVVWYQTEKYRVGLFVNNEGVIVRDLRQFNDGVEEACLKAACEALKLGFSANQAIDEVNFGTRWVLDEGKVTDYQVSQTNEALNIQYKNGAGLIRKISFLANDIKVDDDIKTISTAILNAVESSQNTNTIVNQDEKDFISKVEWSQILPGLLLDGFKFLVFVILFLIIPGFVLSKRLLLALPVGIAVFTLLAFLLSVIELGFLLWLVPLVAVAAGFWWKNELPKIYIEKNSLIVWGLIVVGSLSWMLTQLKNGLLFNYGYGYWGPNGHDAIWHLQLINALTKSVPPQNFVFSGQPLENYHYFFDLLAAKAVLMFSIDPQNVLFRFFPLLISISLGLLVYHLTLLLGQKMAFSDARAKLAGLVALFFVYFGGSFGWIVSFFKDRSFGGETTFWAQQSVSTLLNPPFAISLVLLFAGIYLYYSTDFSKKKDVLQKGLLIVLVWGVLIEFKAYAGILMLGSLGIITVFKIFQKQFLFVAVAGLTLALSLLVFLPNNAGSNQLITFSPLWLVRTMVESEDRLGWVRLLMTMQSGVWYKVIAAYGIGIVLFIIGNLGFRAIAFLNPKIFLRFGLLSLLSGLGLILALLFLQEGTGWNIVQFFYYTLMIQGIFAGLVIGSVSRIPKLLTCGVLAVVVILTIPTSLNTLSQYLPKRPPAKLSTQEAFALRQLAAAPDGVVLSPVFEEKLTKKYVAPKPLFAYASSSYVSAFSGKPSFLADSINLDILGIDYKARVNTTREILKGTINSHQLLSDNNISYIYLPKKTTGLLDEGKVGIEKLFENDEVIIYKVK